MEEEGQQDFKLVLAQKKFLVVNKDIPNVDRPALTQELIAACIKDDLAPMYEHLCATLSVPVDQAKLDAMKVKNIEHLSVIDAKIKDAEDNLGETEVRDALLARADYLAKLGDKEGAVKAYATTEERTTGSGNKVDLVLSQIRLFMFYGDWKGIKELLTKVQSLCDDGGDWERKNRLKVYQGVFAMYTREFKKAADLFLESIATFTTNELFPYARVIFYAVVCSVLALDRPALKAKVVDSPEVLAVIGQHRSLAPFLNALYECKYKEFVRAFVDVVEQVREDMFLSTHARYYMREVRVVTYTQFLESYKSVTLASMAAAFDVSVEFLDTDLADFIVAGRLNAKIDKVAGIVETNRPDAKNQLYADVIRKGDHLLNNVQKLSRVIDIE